MHHGAYVTIENLSAFLYAKDVSWRYIDDINYFLYEGMEIDVIIIGWRKRSIPTHSGWLYPLTFDAGKGLKEA